MAGKSKVVAAQVGDELDIKGSAYVALPDANTVVSTYMRYTFRLPGRHTVTLGNGDVVEYDVTEPEPEAEAE